MMSELRDKVFLNKEELQMDSIRKYQLNSIEDINKDLVDYSAWDMATPVSAVSLNIGNDAQISQASFHVFGDTDPKRLDAKTVFGDNYQGENHQVKIERIDLQKLIFRGSLVSEWMGPQEFSYSVQRPSSSQPGSWREVEERRVEEDGGACLWLRAVVQPWTGLKMKMTLGIMATKDIRKIPEHQHPRFPFINFLSIHIPIMPYPPAEVAICLPFVPYLLPSGEEDDEYSLPEWRKIVRASNGPF